MLSSDATPSVTNYTGGHPSRISILVSNTLQWLLAGFYLALVGTIGAVSSGRSEAKGQGHWSLEKQAEDSILEVGHLKDMR